MQRRGFLKTMGLGTAALALPKVLFAGPKAQARSNILFIMSDDHATNAISCYGGMLSKVAKTPNIDRIAADGVRLTNCFCTNSICTPSRATILTGQYSHVNGVYILSDQLDPDRQNVAKLLQNAGYQTAVVGKWHLKTQPAGFDYWNVLPGQGRYYDPLLKEKGRLWEPGNAGGQMHKGYATDIITDISLGWLRNRDPDKPFFLLCHHKSPHGLWEYATRHAHLYQDVTIPEPASLWEDKSHRVPASRDCVVTIGELAERMAGRATRGRKGRKWPTGRLDISGMDEKQKKSAAYQKYLKDYLRCVAAIDENVGRMLDYLDREGLTENTAVIYTSDQGMFLGEHDYYDKRFIYEESLRMPFLVRYPREIKPHSVNEDIIINADFAPTFLDLAGEPTPPDMQGRSLRPNLAGQTPPDWRTSMYYRYWMHGDRPAHYGVRTKRYKLIFFYSLGLDKTKGEPMEPGWELYDLEKDPREMKNIYNDPLYVNVVKELKREIFRLKRELGDTDEKYPELVKLREEHL